MMQKQYQGAPLEEGVSFKRFQKTWRRLLGACRPFRVSLIFAVLCALAAAMLTIFAPLQLATLTDLFSQNIQTGVDAASFGEVAWRLLAFYAGIFALSALGKWLMSGISQHVSHHLRHAISKKINRLPTRDAESTEVGDLLSRVTNDMDSVGHAMHEVLAELPSALCLLFGSLILMFVTNFTLALVATATTLLGVVLTLYIMEHSQKHFERQQQVLGDLNSRVEELYSGHTSILSAGAEEAAKARFEPLNQELEKDVFYARFWAGLLVPLMSFTANLGYLAVCVAGALLAWNGQLSFGVIVAFIFLVHHFTHPFAEIANCMQAMQSAAAAGERVFAFLDAPELLQDEQSSVPLGSVHGTVEFENVSFRYPGAKQDAIRDFSLRVEAGQKIAILGPSGAGKSTLMRLLDGTYLPDKGEVRIDGIPTSKLSQKDIHRLFAPVFRTPWMFEGSLRENLIYCAEGTSESKMVEACRAVGVDRFIRTLPQGYDTVLKGELAPSVGQLQQLQIARALLSGHPMLILDEATGGMDPLSEARAFAAVDEFTSQRTVFVTAHHVSATQNADTVLVMEEGRIAAMGTHEDLLGKNEFYTALYQSQRI